MLSRASVIPAPFSAELSPELDEWNVKRSAHEWLLVLTEQTHRGSDVLGVTIVTRDCNSLLLDGALCEFICDCLDHERFHHASTITQHITSEGVEDLVAMSPSNRSVHCCFRNVVSAIVNERLPFHVSSCGEALDTFTEW